MSDQYVADDERDAILDRLLTLPENKVCFDCKSKNPKWASSSIGIFLCYQCTSIHRNLGVHISFVRSLKMDRWKLKELKQMELGGNKNAQIYFEKNGMFSDGKPNHKAPQHTKYKQDLLRRVEMEIGSSQQTNVKSHIGVEHQGSAVFNAVPPFGGLSVIKDNTVVSEQAQMKTNNIGISGNSNNFFEEIKEQQPQVQKKTTSLIQQNSSSGGLTFGLGGMVKQTEVKTLNAKKLDVNFDNDDFFNSFEPTKQQQSLVKEPSFGQNQNSGTRLQEVTNETSTKSQSKNNNHVFNMDNQQFSFGGTPIQSSTNPKFTSPSDEYEAQQRLKSLGNKKGISSEDIFGHREPKSDEVVQRYNQLAGARAISSDMFFGNQNTNNSNQNLGDEVEGYMLGRNSTNSKDIRINLNINIGNNSYDEYKEQAAKIAEKVQENAKILKEKALDWLSTFTQLINKMKVSNIRQMQKLDPEDVSEAPGDKEREYKRKSIIKSFLWWSSGEKERWNSQNNEERIIVKRQFAYTRMLTIFGLFSNFAIYNCFFTGIYNFRTSELLDMRRVPFLVKFSLSSLLAYQMCKRLWETNIYEAELYQVALKYRNYYDKSLLKDIEYAAENTDKSSQKATQEQESSNKSNLQTV